MHLSLVRILGTILCAGALVSQVQPALAQLSAADPRKVILDTDFVMPPQDDSMALMLVLKSPELKLLGVTTVAGNDTMQRATNDALRELEIAGRTDVAVYRGANQPLVHENADWSRTWGHYLCCRDTTVLPDAQTTPPPPGGFAKRLAEKESAVDFIIRSVNANPGQVTIIAIGPLTNIATAIRQEPGLAKKIKSLSIMGGVIWSLPLGPEGGGRRHQPRAGLWNGCRLESNRG